MPIFEWASPLSILSASASSNSKCGWTFMLWEVANEPAERNSTTHQTPEGWCDGSAASTSETRLSKKRCVRAPNIWILVCAAYWAHSLANESVVAHNARCIAHALVARTAYWNWCWLLVVPFALLRLQRGKNAAMPIWESQQQQLYPTRSIGRQKRDLVKSETERILCCSRFVHCTLVPVSVLMERECMRLYHLSLSISICLALSLSLCMFRVVVRSAFCLCHHEFGISMPNAFTEHISIPHGYRNISYMRCTFIRILRCDRKWIQIHLYVTPCTKYIVHVYIVRVLLQWQAPLLVLAFSSVHAARLPGTSSPQ